VPKDLPHPTAIFAGKVNYIDYDQGWLVDPSPALNTLSLIVHKRMSFAHESEVRAVCSINANCDRHSSSPRYAGIYVDCDLDRLVEQIYISPLAPPYFREAVSDLCQRFALAATVVQSDLMSKPLY
jgi:hypothetical protein